MLIYSCHLMGIYKGIHNMNRGHIAGCRKVVQPHWMFTLAARKKGMWYSWSYFRKTQLLQERQGEQ